jgi:hypothetical protein
MTKTFIGSSSEGIKVANAIKAHLINKTDCNVWTDDVFLPGELYIETIEKLLNSMDYAILVATPDDMLEKRDVKNLSMRDNVLLELGLFMAKLGRSRTYLITPEDKPIHIPSDLLGITAVSYISATSEEEVMKNLKAPCEKIMKAMQQAEKELSASMRRFLVKRLLGFTNQIQKLTISVQNMSINHITDRRLFEKVKKDSVDQLANLVKEYVEDAEKLGITGEANKLHGIVNEAIISLPFPEEMVVTNDELVGGMLNHFLGNRSGKDQVKERLSNLIKRYEEWGNKYWNRITSEINELQNNLISLI